jgi:hypothetical protein
VTVRPSLAGTAFSEERAQSNLSEVEREGLRCVQCGDQYSAKSDARSDAGAGLPVCADSEMCARRISQLHLMGIT